MHGLWWMFRNGFMWSCGKKIDNCGSEKGGEDADFERSDDKVGQMAGCWLREGDWPDRWERPVELSTSRTWLSCLTGRE